MLLIFKYQILEHSQMVMDDSKEVVFQQLLLDLQGPNREISYQAKRELEDIADNRSIEPLIEWYTNSANEMYLEPKTKAWYRDFIMKSFKNTQNYNKKMRKFERWKNKRNEPKWWHHLFNILRPIGYRKCKEDEIIFVLRNYSLKYAITNSGCMIWPLTKHTYHKLSLEPFKIDIDVWPKTKENIRLKHNSTASLTISTSEYLIGNFVDRLINLRKLDDKIYIMREIIEGQIRLTTNKYTIKEITLDSATFYDSLISNISAAIRVQGLYLESLEVLQLEICETGKELLGRCENVQYEEETPGYRQSRERPFKPFGFKITPRKGEPLSAEVEKSVSEILRNRRERSLTKKNQQRSSTDQRPRESTNLTQTLKDDSHFSKNSCVKCGKVIMSNHAVAKATKAAVYTPATTWVGMTIGMAFGGLPGLFLGGLMGGAGGVGKALEEKLVCSDCKYK